MTRKSLLILATLLAAAAAHAEVKLLRHPTYSNGKVAFSYLGDLWIANENGSGVLRLTDNQARDVFPRFSPDGNWIAFSSNREGNYDVYVIPAERRQTAAAHLPFARTITWWAGRPTERRSCSRPAAATACFPRVTTLWEVAGGGRNRAGRFRPIGAPGPVTRPTAKLAFTRHPAPWSRKHYRGSYAADLWVMDVASKKFTRLGGEDYKGNRLWPMYARNGEIYYVSNQTRQ